MTGGRLLLHTCCGPCLTVVQRELRDEGFDITSYFCNPNIHPWKEWERRLSTLSEYADSMGLPLEIRRDYPLENNVGMLLKADDRCSACFTDRLTETARKAASMGMPFFSTTLTVSPYQDSGKIERAGLKAAEAYGVEFVFRDYRELYRESVRLSREAGMYRQPYCGCVFSERDRYLGVK